ncbi:MAG: hypothetical protein HQ549_03090 [Candidatus Omnitrophica bacterium]|nr:hypothetical protein [Candidatus Omnitrophota bacterium]
MKNKKLVVLIILGIGAILSLIYGITTPSRGKRSAATSRKPQEAVTQDNTAQHASKIVPTARRAKKTEFTTWKRNPFTPTGVPGTSSSALTLGGIMWQEVSPKAMVSNEIVGIGDKVGGYKVIDIKKDRVVLSDGKENHTLYLK